MKLSTQIATFVFAGLFAIPAFAAPAPKTIGFTGILTAADGSRLTDGTHAVHLALYDAATGGDQLWHEDKSITLTRGLFSTALGDATPFPTTVDFGTALFVGVSTDSDPEMAPRIALQGVPYALFAQSIANGAVGNAALASDGASLARVSGGAVTANAANIGIGTATPLARLDVRGLSNDSNVAPNALDVTGGLVRIGDPGGDQLEPNGVGIKFMDRGKAHASLKFVGSLAGGAASHIDFGLSSAGEALALDGTPAMTLDLSNSRVGIGLSSPATALDVNGTARVTGLRLTTGAAANRVLTSDASGNATWQAAPTSPWLTNSTNLYYSGGNVGIGTSTPGAALDVRGDIRLGSSGALIAPGAAESLRIIRGTVGADGTAARGAGYTSTRSSTGVYYVNFPAGTFSAFPSGVFSGRTVNRVVSGSATDGGGGSFYFSVVSEDLNNNVADASFDFIIMGPQ